MGVFSNFIGDIITVCCGFNNKCENHFFEAPRKDNKTSVDIKFSMERPTIEELKQRINIFIKGLTL